MDHHGSDARGIPKYTKFMMRYVDRKPAMKPAMVFVGWIRVLVPHIFPTILAAASLNVAISATLKKTWIGVKLNIIHDNKMIDPEENVCSSFAR